MKLKIPCKTVPFYNNSWCIAYMVGKMMKLAFQRIQRFIIWTSQEGVMTKTLKKDCTEAQKTRRNWRPPHECSRPLTFHLSTWLLQFTSILETSHSINITSRLLEKDFLDDLIILVILQLSCRVLTQTLVLSCYSWTCEEIPLGSTSSCFVGSSTAAPPCVD